MARSNYDAWDQDSLQRELFRIQELLKRMQPDLKRLREQETQVLQDLDRQRAATASNQEENKQVTDEYYRQKDQYKYQIKDLDKQVRDLEKQQSQISKLLDQ